jgi:Restriction endonuclease
MNRYFKLVCTHENPDWYLQEFLAGRVRFGWSGPGCDLREINRKNRATWSDDQRVTWSYTKFLVERIVPGDRVVVQTEQPIERFVVAEVIPPGCDYAPGDLDDFNHLLHARPLTPNPIPVNSNAITAALKHDLSKRGHYYEIYPEESIRELDALVDQVAANKVDLTAIRTDADTLDHTLRDTKRHIIREISRKWPGKDFERFCEMLLRKVDYIEVKELRDSGKGWDLLVRIVNPLTQTILLDDVPVQCKNYAGDVTSLAPIDDLDRCIRNSNSQVAYLFILGRLSEKFREALQIRQETLQKELDRPVSLEIVTEDRIAEIYATYVVRGLSGSRGAV